VSAEVVTTSVPTWVWTWIDLHDTGRQIRSRMLALVSEMRAAPCGEDWLLRCEEWTALAWQLGGFVVPPDADIEAVLSERGWLIRPYHDAYDPDDALTETAS